MQHLTSISRIGKVKRFGDEWSSLKKTFTADKLPSFAAIRADSQGTCGIFLNGEFLETSEGRYCNRITYVECTSKLRLGENEIELRLGSHYYEETGKAAKDRRGAWFSAAAAELEMIFEDGRQTVVTDKSWICESDEGVCEPELFSEVTVAEYDRFWRSAALWREQKKLNIPNEVLRVAGEEYGKYTSRPVEKYAVPIDSYEKYGGTVYDFGKLYVGYLEIECESENDENIKLLFDYTESDEDFDEEKLNPKGIVVRLSLNRKIKKGKNSIMILRRRAFRYMKIASDAGVSISSVRLRLCMMPYTALGWFRSPDPMLNKMWEVGKYTLHVNKHREYESCPRNEMKYFSGDGIIDALVDYYAFGDSALLDASYSITEIDGNSGIRHNIYERNSALWDYPAWRIITAYNHYTYFADEAFINKYYGEFKINMEWMIERMSSNYLIYQYPVYLGPFYSREDAVEYTCSEDRLGEKTLLNSLFYKSLVCMSELAKLVDDCDGEKWSELAEKVKLAFNERLWDESRGAYIDTFEPSYIPQDGNALAVLFGLADDNRAKRVFDTLIKENWSPYGAAILSEETNHTRGGASVISPVTCMYEAEARFIKGDVENALELIRRTWGTMLKKGAETFWEFAPNNGTERWRIPSHAWSSGCAYLLSAYVLGIRPSSPAYGEMIFEPYEGFSELRGVVPTAKGLVAVRCETENGVKKYTLAIPYGIELKANIPNGALLDIVRYPI